MQTKKIPAGMLRRKVAGLLLPRLGLTWEGKYRCAAFSPGGKDLTTASGKEQNCSPCSQHIMA